MKMSRNTYIGKHMGRRSQRTIRDNLHCLTFFALCVTATLSAACQRYPASSPDASAQSESALTISHHTEAEDAVAAFESNWLSYDAHRDPAVQSQFATGPYLEYFGFARRGAALANEASWTVTRRAIVRTVRVLEYTASRMKAVACVTDFSDEVSTDGVVRRSLSPLDFCGVYVFVWEDVHWKVAGFFNLADRRHWDYAQDWLRRIIGDLPPE